jgi:hypothetical protein
MRSWRSFHIHALQTIDEIVLKRRITRIQGLPKEGEVRKILIHYVGDTITFGRFEITEVKREGEHVYIRCKRVRNRYTVYNAGEMDE